MCELFFIGPTSGQIFFLLDMPLTTCDITIERYSLLAHELGGHTASTNKRPVIKSMTCFYQSQASNQVT